MATLFVEQSISIDSAPTQVWEVLTLPEFSSEWARAFTNGAPLVISSTWALGDSVLWQDQEGQVLVAGVVTEVEPNKRLRFTVSDTSRPAIKKSSEDGITFGLVAQNGGTDLHVRHGDFSAMQDGQLFFDRTQAIWDKALPIVKNLSEHKP